MPMSRTEFNKCPECRIGTMRPTGGAATITDPDTGTDTTDYREYQCDNCGYPRGGKAKVATVNKQVGVRDNQQQQPPNTTIDDKSSSNNTINPT
jgi:ribosomal protein S27E